MGSNIGAQTRDSSEIVGIQIEIYRRRDEGGKAEEKPVSRSWMGYPIGIGTGVAAR